MFALKDILELLDHWPKWKKIQAAPGKIEDLEKRFAELEKRLARCPGEGCPRCGELSYRTVSSEPHQMFGNVGLIVRTMKCEKCGFTEDKTVPPKSSK
jgi:ribosomal protein L37E